MYSLFEYDIKITKYTYIHAEQQIDDSADSKPTVYSLV